MVWKVSQMATNSQIMPALNFLIIMICPLRGIYDLMTANHAFLQHSKNDIYFFLFKSRPEIYSNIWDLNMRIMLFWIAQLLYILKSTWVLGTPNAGQSLIFPGFSLIFAKFWLTPKHKQCWSSTLESWCKQFSDNILLLRSGSTSLTFLFILAYELFKCWWLFLLAWNGK